MLRVVLFLSIVLLVWSEETTKGQDLCTFLSEADLLEDKKLEFRVDQSKKTGKVGALSAFAKAAIKEGDIVYKFDTHKSTINLEHLYPSESQDDKYSQFVNTLKSLSLNERSKGNKNFDFTKEKEANPHLLYDDQIIKLLLIFLRHQQVPSPWTAYIEALPSTFETPLFWEENELKELKGTKLHTRMVRLREAIDKDYKELFPKLRELHPQQFAEGTFTLDEYKWAHAVHSSRAWYNSTQLNNPLLPLFEAFNYKEEASVKFEEDENGVISLIATEDIAAGEEVIINEGRVRNSELLEYYGFVLTKGADNYIEVSVGLDSADQLYGNKKKMFHKASITNNHIFKLRGTEIPRDLLFALRVYHATVYDWEFVDNAFNDKMISYQNELKVAQTIIELCEDSLQQYETTGKEDKALLETVSNSRVKAAIVLRRAEKKVLTKTLSKARAAEKQVKSSWHYRTMDIPGTNEMRTTLTTSTSEIL